MARAIRRVGRVARYVLSTCVLSAAVMPRYHSARRMRAVRIVPLLLFLASYCVAASAPARHSSHPKPVSGSGCVEKAAENSCRVVIDTKTGELYNLLFPAKTPKSGTAIQFTGVAQHGASSCMQGKPVKVSKWKKEKGIRCPPPAVMANNR